jgi:hypothetical protein
MVKKVLVILLAVFLIVGVFPDATYSQQQSLQDMIINGGFEGGFQEEFGVGYGWGGFSNGNAVAGWGYDDWEAVVSSGKYSQRLEVSEALDQNRIIGIYQTVSVVPGEQYKLSLKGMIRSEEGTVALSDYGYRIQYAIDYDGQTAWEIVDEAAWQELPWDEQSLTPEEGAAFQIDDYSTTITAQSDRLTLFVRGWKKWLDNGTGVFNLDEVSLIGPAPAGFQAPVSQQPQLAAVSNEVVAEITEAAPEQETAVDQEAGLADEAQPAMPAVNEAEALPSDKPAAVAEAEVQVEDSELPAEAEQATETEVVSGQSLARSVEDGAQLAQVAPLPATGEGDDNSLIYVVAVGSVVLLALFVSAIMATTRRRSPVDR